MKYETVIGLEVHTQLKTHSKIFSGSSTQFGAEPNTQASAIDLGLPGVLPVLNQSVVDLAITFGLSVNANINQASIFARKNYFYPDLPKGYQISQYDQPIVAGGYLDIEVDNGNGTNIKRINLTRAHLEEDAGKSLHQHRRGQSGIDLNRAGTPLLEIVSEPELRSSAETIAYLKTLHQLVRYLDISDGNMQEGSFRCDVNISLRPIGQTTLGTRSEIKNVNSFRFVEQAILFEIERQSDLLDRGEKVLQETRQFDPQQGVTRSMRLKEEAHDYRYFPDPDLLPVIISDEKIEAIRQQLPELPQQKRQRYSQTWSLSTDDTKQLTDSRQLALYFEETVTHSTAAPKLIANWILGEVKAQLNKNEITIEEIPVSAAALANLIKRVSDETISSNSAKDVFAAMWQGEGSADDIIKARGLTQISDSSELDSIIAQIIQDNPDQATQYRAGKEKLLTFFVGQVMKATRGKANPKQVNALLKKHLQHDADQ